ncbi:hypothetical protein B0I12_002226 [Microbacterium hydrothermale]|uniref:hypothetical protein n=1 Tax=Microbacterium hydrothermale TaxID=857427 RepID=UPI002225F9D9|nr:hypothetical protein [Microbacterium hydrothermale]MCW2165071.1 hypothetical protein [Microbacterium hydrothermale]
MAVIVTAPAVQVIVGGRAHFLEEGAVLPDGVDEQTLKRFRAEGLIADEAKVEKPKSGSLDEGVYKDVSVKDLKADIAARNEGREDADKVTPAEPGNRPEIVAALLADDAKQ